MRILIQRVKEARVEVEGLVTGRIDTGLVVLLGVAKSDDTQDADYLIEKLEHLRVFPDGRGKMNRSVLEAGGKLLIVPNFTLYGDCRRGRRPSFELAAPPDQAGALYSYFVDTARALAIPVETGIFQASMAVFLVNDGPVTLLCDSDSGQRYTGKSAQSAANQSRRLP